MTPLEQAVNLQDGAVQPLEEPLRRLGRATLKVGMFLLVGGCVIGLFTGYAAFMLVPIAFTSGLVGVVLGAVTRRATQPSPVLSVINWVYLVVGVLLALAYAVVGVYLAGWYFTGGY